MSKIVSGTIYGLHSGDGEIRYIGYTINLPSRRLSQHKHTARTGGKSYKNTWIRSIGVENLELVVLEYYTDIPLDDLENREIRAIAEARSLGWRLTNGTDGGNTGGSVGYVHSTPRSDPRKGKKYTEEEKSTLYSYMQGESNAFFGRSHTEETKKLMSERHRGKRMSAESRRRMSESAKSRKASPETLEKMRYAGHKRWHLEVGKTNPKCNFCVTDLLTTHTP